MPEVATSATDRTVSDSRQRVANVEAAKHDLRVLYRVIRDPRTQWYVPLLMAGVFLYGISPVDLLPDVFPILGILDEAMVFVLCRAAVYRIVPDATVEEHAEVVAEDGRRRFTLTHLIGGIAILQLVIIGVVVVVAAQWLIGVV